MPIGWVRQQEVAGGSIRAGFTDRSGGVSVGNYAGLNLGHHVGDERSAVEENRKALAEEIGVRPVYMDQVHSATLRSALPYIADKSFAAPTTDGLIVDLAQVGAPSRAAACVMVADCIPVLIVSAERPAAAAVHAGRRGLLSGIVPAAVERVGGLVDVYAGPCICGSCYEVSAQMAEESASVLAPTAAVSRWGTPALDLRAGLRAQLSDLHNVRSVHIDERCTMEDSALYSYRRATRSVAGGPEKPATGRIAGVIVVEKEEQSDTPASPR